MVQDFLSRAVMLQLWHSIWTILVQKGQYCEAFMVLVVDGIQSWNDG